MRVGAFEVIMKSRDSSDQDGFPEMLVNGQHCFAIEPGMEFLVKVKIYPDADGRFPYQYLKMALYIDGYDVREWKRVNLTPEGTVGLPRHAPKCVTFWGFKNDATSSRPFVTGPLQQLSSDRYIPDAFQEEFGTVRVLVFESYIAEGEFMRAPSGCPNIYHPEPKTVSETTKFYQNASVTTLAGEVRPRDDKYHVRRPFDPRQWRTVNQEPDLTLTVLYHTASMISFLRDFHERNRQDEAARVAEAAERAELRAQQSLKRKSSSCYRSAAVVGNDTESESEDGEEVEVVHRAPKQRLRSEVNLL